MHVHMLYKCILNYYMHLCITVFALYCFKYINGYTDTVNRSILNIFNSTIREIKYLVILLLLLFFILDNALIS